MFADSRKSFFFFVLASGIPKNASRSIRAIDGKLLILLRSLQSTSFAQPREQTVSVPWVVH